MGLYLNIPLICDIIFDKINFEVNGDIMGHLYKSTIVIYSDKDWSDKNVTELVVDLDNLKSNSSICHLWTIVEVDKDELAKEDFAEEILNFFEIDESYFDIESDRTYGNPFSEEDYEFYPEPQ